MNFLSKFIRTISNNMSIKISSLAIALTLWIFVVTGSEYVHDIEIPIKLRNVQPDRVLAEQIPEFAKVKMRGSGRQFFNHMLRAKFADVGIMLEMSRIRFFYDFELEPYLKRFPDRLSVPRDFGLELVEVVSPDTIRVRLDSFIEKEVTVSPRVTISMDPGYIQVGDFIIEPSVVKISGPASILNNINEIFTEEKSFEARKNSVNKTINLSVQNSELVQLEPSRVQLSASIQSIGVRTVGGIEVKVRNVPENLKAIVNPAKVSVELQGGITFLTNLEGADILASIDYAKDWKENQRLYELNVEVPKGVIKWNNLNPSTVEVIVIRERVKSENSGN